MAEFVEELLDAIRDFRHQYQRFHMYGVPCSGAKVITALVRLRRASHKLEREIKQSLQLKRRKSLIQDVDELLRIVKTGEEVQDNEAGD